MENNSNINALLPFANNKGVMLEVLEETESFFKVRFASFNFRGEIEKSKTSQYIKKEEIFIADNIFISEAGKNKDRHYWGDERGMYTRIYFEKHFEPYFKL